MTFERFAFRWFAMNAVRRYVAACPDDPQVIALHASFDRLRRTLKELRWPAS